MQRTYFAIDLKSYYASAECAARHLDPLTTNLVVADSSRTEKTTCLAVSPSLKAYGIPGRARLFEVVQKVKEVNANRLREAVRLRKAVYKDGKLNYVVNTLCNIREIFLDIRIEGLVKTGGGSITKILDF